MEQRTFHTGDRVPHSGIYAITHAAHRLPHECILIEGNQFPRCAKCGDAVEFVCTKSVPAMKTKRFGVVVLYELPEITPDESILNGAA